MRADLGALAAAYAGRGAGLAGDAALILIDAADKDTHRAGTLVPQFDNPLGAGFHTCAAGSALAFVNDRKTGFGIHVDGTELAGLDTVAAAETAVRATGVAAVERRLYLAGLHPVVDIGLRPVRAASVAADHGHPRGMGLDFIAENAGHLLHHIVTSDRTVHAVEVRRLDCCVGKGATAGESASAAVRTGHHLLHLIDTRVFLDLELLGHPEEDKRKDQAYERKDHDGQDNSVCHYFLMLNIYSFLSLPRKSHRQK